MANLSTKRLNSVSTSKTKYLSKNLHQFISQLETLIKEKHHEKVDFVQLKHELENLGGLTLSLQEDFLPYCHTDNSKNYTRNLIWKCDYFALLLLCWNKNEESAIHAHGGSQCWLRCLKGELIEHVYDANPYEDLPSLEPSHSTILHPGEACYIDDGMGVHKIQNSDQPSITLHLYAPMYETTSCFDSVTGKRTTGTVCFDSEYGEKVVQPVTLYKSCPKQDKVSYSSFNSESTHNESSSSSSSGSSSSSSSELYLRDEDISEAERFAREQESKNHKLSEKYMFYI